MKRRRRRRGLGGMEALAWGGQKTLTPKAKKVSGWCVWQGDKKVSCHTRKSAANKAASRRQRTAAKTCVRMRKHSIKVRKRAA